MNDFGYAMILFCSILTREKMVFKNLPRTSFVDLMCKLLGELGYHMRRHEQVGENVGDVEIEFVDDKISCVRHDITKQSPLAFYALGPMLAMRDINSFDVGFIFPDEMAYIMEVLREIGYTWQAGPHQHWIVRRVKPIVMPKAEYKQLSPSAYWTFTMICLALGAKGRCEIIGASQEPELNAALVMLQMMGARVARAIKPVHPNKIIVEGGIELTGFTIDLNDFGRMLR